MLLFLQKQVDFLITLCKLSQKELIKQIPSITSKFYTNKIETENYLYYKGEIPILLVAHLDTVHKRRVKDVVLTEYTLSSPQGIGGDDRCGVFLLLAAAIKAKQKPSLLFLTDEEIGMVGARKFVKENPNINLDVNFMLEYDRRGYNDLVRYDDDNKELASYICKTYKYKESYGSFTDISTLAPYYKISAINLSCAYSFAHTTIEQIDLVALYNTYETMFLILKDKFLLSKQFTYIEAYYSRYYSKKFSQTKSSSKKKTKSCSLINSGEENLLDDNTLHLINRLKRLRLGKEIDKEGFCGSCNAYTYLYQTSYGEMCDECAYDYGVTICSHCGYGYEIMSEETCPDCGADNDTLTSMKGKKK
jgi:hypothetical protein